MERKNKKHADKKTQDAEKMKSDVIHQFEKRFGRKPAVCASAPGRLEVLGNHTDYNEGFVLSAAVGQKAVTAMEGTEGRICTVHERGKDYFIDLDNMEKAVKGDWTNYIKGLLIALRERGISCGAFNAVYYSDVPLSAGMSSSAALEMSVGFALLELFHIDLPLADWARVGQSVENRYLGLNSGLLDQFSSIYGKKDALILCDFRTVEVLKTVPMPGGWSMVVANTMVKHNLVESDYNLRRKSCENALAAIASERKDIKALRDVDYATLEQFKDKMDHIDYLRAKHVVGENERVMQGVKCLEKGDMQSFGKLLFESHVSSRDFFENSCPELDTLVEIAHSLPGCAGARLSGGGFGGISIHLVREELADEYCERLKTAYRSLTGKETETIVCSIGDGARGETLSAE